LRLDSIDRRGNLTCACGAVVPPAPQGVVAMELARKRGVDAVGARYRAMEESRQGDAKRETRLALAGVRFWTVVSLVVAAVLFGLLVWARG
jgi:hypothetical protein